MSATQLVIAQAIDHFDGNTSSHVEREEVLIQRRYRLLLLDHEVDSCGKLFFGYRDGKLHVCVVLISSLQVEVFICPAALRLMSTAELVIAQAIDHFDGNTSHVKREEY